MQSQGPGTRDAGPPTEGTTHPKQTVQQRHGATTRSRATVKRHRERSVPDEAQAILASGVVAHVGFCEVGSGSVQPYVIPFTYHYEQSRPNSLYLHGAPGSRALRHLVSGAPVCVSVTTTHALVYSRSARYHSVNYESVVCFGTARLLADADEKMQLFERMIARYHPGRTIGRDYQAPSPEDLKATVIVEVQIEEMSAKARRGGPLGPLDALPDAPGSCGVSDL
jgi:uncharacterized protein